MKVAKITLWDGSIYYTNEFNFDSLRDFFRNAREKFALENLYICNQSQVDIIEMTEDEYHAIPATNHTYELFNT